MTHTSNQPAYPVTMESKHVGLYLAQVQRKWREWIQIHFFSQPILMWTFLQVQKDSCLSKLSWGRKSIFFPNWAATGDAMRAEKRLHAAVFSAHDCVSWVFSPLTSGRVSGAGDRGLSMEYWRHPHVLLPLNRPRHLPGCPWFVGAHISYRCGYTYVMLWRGHHGKWS